MVLLVGCQSSTEETTSKTVSKDGQTKTTTRTTGKTPGKKNKNIQHIVQRTHHFSSPDQPDYFRLALHGDAVTSGQVEFTITTQGGQKIYEEHFPAADLEASMVYEMKTPTASPSEREAYILKRMEEFFQPSNFISPAISEGASLPTDTNQVATWKRIQANPASIGFKYLLGKEDGRLLAYDPAEKKAVRYGSFGG
ncbi:hypothetical protein [Rufibacter radiotolerans]|uniref:hypothetical protein n=1 Tax=Rufibacter radiotolerans TaxID=1379910 RepID=UPI0018CF1BFC|nr:hypothetical protein [Rufibacter radiotolerans]